MVKDNIIEYKIEYKNYIIKEAKIDNREFTAVISTDDMDHSDEVLLPAGMQTKAFKTNPIILFNHNKDLPIGTAISLRRSGNGWIAKGKLAEGIERIDEIWELVKQKVLKGISIGFIPVERRIPNPEDIKLFGKKVRRIISKFKLLEFSIVSIPANQNALILACKDLEIDPKNILGEEYIEEEILEEKEEKGIDEEIEKEIEVLDVEIKEEQKEEIIKVIKEQKVDMKEVLRYFSIEIKEQIAKSKGQLF